MFNEYSAERRQKEGILPYIFGYGSLIEQASRMRTTPSAMYVLPARAPGFARGWWARTGAIGFTTTFVGAIPEKSSSMNGVVYAVSEEELKATNQREQGYTRDGHHQHRSDPLRQLQDDRQSLDLRQRFQERRAGEECAHAPVSHRAIVRRYLPDRLPAN